MLKAGVEEGVGVDVKNDGVALGVPKEGEGEGWPPNMLALRVRERERVC